MINYHQVYPYQYIALTCLFYALTVSLSVSWLNRLLGWRRVLAILAVMAFSLLAASGPGGLLWTFHDMQAGHVPSWGFFWINVRWGFMAGLETGWAIVAFSIPYNIIGLAVGYWLTSWVLRTQTPQRLRES